MAKPESPTPKCPHGYKVVILEENGWLVPYPSPKCGVCEPNKPCGSQFRHPGDTRD